MGEEVPSPVNCTGEGSAKKSASHGDTGHFPLSASAGRRLGPAPQAWEGEGLYAMESSCEAQTKNPLSVPESCGANRRARNRSFGPACANRQLGGVKFTRQVGATLMQCWRGFNSVSDGGPSPSHPSSLRYVGWAPTLFPINRGEGKLSLPPPSLPSLSTAVIQRLDFLDRWQGHDL
jgi:hypothetical protein